MKIIKYIYILTFLTVGILFYSCQKLDDQDVKYSSTFPVSGEWWVRMLDAEGNVVVDYAKIETYNLASDKGDSIWIDDLGNTWTFKIKAACNVKAKTFAVDSIPSVAYSKGEPYFIKVDVKDGHVIEKGGLTKGGNVSDSIFMHIGFEDESGTVYTIAGVRRTGFSADEY